jgi:peptidyl-tRNA hydrolase
MATSIMDSTTTVDHSSDNASTSQKPIVQYIFVRRDLQDWPAGAVAAQVAHASVAAVAQGVAAQHSDTLAYIAPSNLPHMIKNVYGVDTLEDLYRVKTAWNDFILTNNTTSGLEETQESSSSKDKNQQDDQNNNDDICRQAYLWIEQPENIPTAMATWPIQRTNKVSKIIKKLKLSYL